MVARPFRFRLAPAGLVDAERLQAVLAGGRGSGRARPPRGHGGGRGRAVPR